MKPVSMDYKVGLVSSSHSWTLDEPGDWELCRSRYEIQGGDTMVCWTHRIH
jgi:hypothetical protein